MPLVKERKLYILGKTVTVLSVPGGILDESSGGWSSGKNVIVVASELNEEQWVSTIWHEVLENVTASLLGEDISKIPQEPLLEQAICAIEVGAGLAFQRDKRNRWFVEMLNGG